MIQIHKGDYLTFASIGDALELDADGPFFKSCEVQPGIWRRHPDIGERSRSDISRDGYLGVIFNALVRNDHSMITRIREAGPARRWTMGDRGNFDYINIWPLVPILYAFKYQWMPTIPTLCTKFNNRGFRAHLLAIAILIEHLMGKDRWSHRQGAKGLAERNNANRWFDELDRLVHGRPANLRRLPPYGRDFHWGGCPQEVFEGLVDFTRGLPR
jgi:hypothetical protein